jgi:hypothetical protein
MFSRGQFSIEMFFAFTFAILLVFWFINYIDLFSSVSDKVPIQVSQRIIARDIAKIVNGVCSYSTVRGDDALGIRTLISPPCLQQKRDSLFYNLSVGTDGKTLMVFNSLTNYTASMKANCKIEVIANLTRCTANSFLCIYKDMSIASPMVVVTDQIGECL